MNPAKTPLFLPESSEQALLRVLWYFHYFQHALNFEEVHKYLGIRMSGLQLEVLLRGLVAQGQIVEREGFYALEKGDLDHRIGHRALNLQWLATAEKYSRFIERFPFVRSVFISGSLSKMGIDQGAHDIDYFLVVAPGRVWTAKFFLMAFKKVFLFNSHKHFCINLLRDETHLKFDKENIYIATEIASLLPMGQNGHREAMIENNSWVFHFFPNWTPHRDSGPIPRRKNAFEPVLDFFLGNRFEEGCRRLFEGYIKKRRSHRLAYFETLPHSSAFFPESFESRVLENYRSKFNES